MLTRIITFKVRSNVFTRSLYFIRRVVPADRDLQAARERTLHNVISKKERKKRSFLSVQADIR